MNKQLIYLVLSILLLSVSCSNNNLPNTETMNHEMTAENYDILIIYSREEHSKDSNGTEIKIGLKDNTLTYHERHWGFKAIKKVTEKKIKIDDVFLNHINEFIKNNLPNKNYKKEIEIDRKRAFNTFRYELFVNDGERQYNNNISTKNQNTDNEYYNNLESLFSEMKSKFKLKGKY